MTVLPLLARLPYAIGRAVVALSHKGRSSDIRTWEGAVCSDRLEREMSDRMARSGPIWLASVCDNRADWHPAD